MLNEDASDHNLNKSAEIVIARRFSDIRTRYPQRDQQ
jgi:hypothetical protein